MAISIWLMKNARPRIERSRATLPLLMGALQRPEVPSPITPGLVRHGHEVFRDLRQQAVGFGFLVEGLLEKGAASGSPRRWASERAVP